MGRENFDSAAFMPTEPAPSICEMLFAKGFGMRPTPPALHCTVICQMSNYCGSTLPTTTSPDISFEMIDFRVSDCHSSYTRFGAIPRFQTIVAQIRHVITFAGSVTADWHKLPSNNAPGLSTSVAVGFDDHQAALAKSQLGALSRAAVPSRAEQSRAEQSRAEQSRAECKAEVYLAEDW